ncbi:MAG: hypothetical protein M3P12_14975 [Gemmatimonadota bacterium]|nr:hypothetical protein [Gemmatimonadota bacterium]
MKKSLALVTLIVAVVVAGSADVNAQARFQKATFRLDNFTTQLQTEPIYWVGPDGVTYVIDRYYEFTATLSWSRFPPKSSQRLEIFDPSKDQSATVDVTGVSSYTFNGTVENGWWAFPGDSISFRLIVCLKPTYESCLTYDASAQIPS